MTDAEISTAQLRTAPPLNGGGTLPHTTETIAKVRALRAEHAQAAAYQAYRVERARAAGHYIEAAHWAKEYRRSAARCRVLGEMLHARRAQVGGVQRANPERGSFVQAHPKEDIPAAGADRTG